MSELRAALEVDLAQASPQDPAACDGVRWHIDRGADLWASSGQRSRLAELSPARPSSAAAPGEVLGVVVEPSGDRARLVQISVAVEPGGADALTGVRPVARDALLQGASLALALFPFPLPHACPLKLIAEVQR